MKKGFVKTANYTRLLNTITQMETRGAREAGMVLVTGEPGLGKTAAVQRVAVDMGAAVFRCCATWTKRALLDSMADLFDTDKRGRNQEVQARIVKHLAAHPVPLVFDEVQHIIGSTAATLECVRDITDATEVICLLVAGANDVHNRLSRYPQIASRIGAVCEFQKLSEADFASVIKQVASVALDTALTARLYAESAGKVRLVLNGLANIERTCEASGAAKATAEMFRDAPLCQEWQARRMRAANAGSLRGAA